MTEPKSTTPGQIEEGLHEGDSSGTQFVNDIPVAELDAAMLERSRLGLTFNSMMSGSAASYSPGVRRLGSFYDQMFTANESMKADQSMQFLMSEINQVSTDRMSTYRILTEFENHYLVTAIYDVVIDELLRDTGQGVTIQVKCKKAEYQSAADAFMDKFQIPLLVEEMLPQLLHYADYSYHVESEPKKGITAIHDRYVPGEVVALYYGLTPTAYFHFPRIRDLRVNSRNRAVTTLMDGVKKLDFNKIWHTSLRGSKIKIDLDDRARAILDTPQIKVGRSLIWPAIDRLQLLRFKEVAENAKDLSRLTRPTLIGVQVPQSESGKTAVAWVQKFEKLLNSGIQDPAVQLSGVDGIISGLSKVMSGRFKAVPTFQSGRGAMEKLPVEDQLAAGGEVDRIKDERELILNILGIPPELVYNSGGDTLSPHRMYARFSKKVKAIQRTITQSIRLLLVHHVATLQENLEVSEDDFDVVMTVAGNMEDIDNAETLGYALENIKSVLEISEAMKQAGVAGYDEQGQGKSVVDPKAFMRYVKKELSAVSINAVEIFIDLDDVDNESIQKPLMTPEIAAAMVPPPIVAPPEPPSPMATGEDAELFGESLVKSMVRNRQVRRPRKHRS